MFRATMIAAVVSAGAWAVGTQASSANRNCCFPGAACCDIGGNLCCLTQTCTTPNLSCCDTGSDCCLENTSFVSAVADEKPASEKPAEVKLVGTLVCGSCKLSESKKCANVLQVKEKDKTINYWLSDKGNDETYHEKICGGGELKDVTVTGVVSEKDGKKWVKVAKFDVKK